MFQESATVETDEQEPSWGDDATSLRLDLLVDDPEVLDILQDKQPGREREAFVHTALKIGVLALQQAGSRIDAERVRNEGDRLMETLTGALKNHREEVTREIAGSLSQYFDPASGHFPQRIKQLVEEGGDMEKAIRSQITGDGSLLVKTLREHMGENSPLLALLDPSSDKGLASSLAKTVDSVAQEQRDAILKEFSLDNTDSALSRTVRELTANHGETGAALEKKIATVVAEFSLDKEDSALSRLVQRVDQAQRTLSDEFSLDKDGSALARMRKEFSEQIAGLVDLQKNFQEEVRVRLAEMAARKAESLKSTAHGFEFEEALFEFLQYFVQQQGDMVSATGTTTGLIPRSKLGDYVMELGAEHAAAGAKVVIEAKQDASYTIAKARQEIEEARKNRDAQIGLFVFSEQSAPANMQRLVRYGSDVFVIWNRDEAASDIILQAGLSLTKALAVRGDTNSASAAADFEAITKALLAVEKQVGRLDDIEKSAKSITSSSEKIRETTDRMRTDLNRQLGRLNESIAAVKKAAG